MIDICLLSIGLALGVFRLNRGLSLIYRVARILGSCWVSLCVPVAIVGVSSVDYFFQMLMFRSRPFNPTYDEHLL